ncbi:importin-4 isoform X1 [Histomonas meleagridis]|uniref:importin-4 isoform X1 n=1 Tax=Histomonas meleagridis TaxID=135588 RepID=UPI00355A9E25|nr:importin-4 isoform X1 [Histomonas meleagridis]KAH0805609.1 importin-4 isoform X1 [Histomonas meleagridis]
MSSLEEIFSKLQTATDNETVEQITQIIMNAYSDPMTIFPLIELLCTNQNPFVRHQSSIGIKQMLEKHWRTYCMTPHGEQIKIALLNALSKESIFSIRHSIIYSLEPICQIREIPWPELDNFAIQLIQSSNPSELEIGMSLFEVIIPYLPESFIVSNIEQICERIGFAMTLNSPELLIATIDFMTSLFQLFDPPIPEGLSQLMEKLLMVFQMSLIQNWPFAYQIAESINKTICTPPRVSSKDLLDFLLNLANNEAVPHELLFHIFNPINTLVSTQYKSIRKQLPALVITVIKCAAYSLQDDCFNNQSDLIFITDVIEGITAEEGEDLFYTIQEILNDSSPNMSFVSLIIFQFFIDEMPGVVAENLQFFVEFIIKQYTNQQHHCIKEESLVCMQHLIRIINGGISQHTQLILRCCLDAISCDHETLVNLGLIAIAELMSTLDFPHELIPQIFNLLCSLLGKSAELQYNVLYSLTALTFASREDILPFVPQLATVFGNSANLNETVHPTLKSIGIEGLARLLCSLPNRIDTIAVPTLNLLNESTKCSDYDVLSSVITSFKLLVESQFPQIESILQNPVELAMKILSTELPIIQSDSEYIPSIIVLKSKSFSFISVCIQRFPNVFTNFVVSCTQIAISHLECNISMLQIECMNTLIILTTTYGLNPTEIIMHLSQLIDNDDPYTVSKLLSSFRKLLSFTTIEINAEQLQGIVNFSYKAMMHKLPCQYDSYDNDIDLIRSLYKFYCMLAQRYPNYFPYDQYISHGRALKKQKQFQELSFLTLPLSYLYKTFGSQLPGVAIKAMIGLIFSTISYCDGTISPLPIKAIYVFIDFDFQTSMQFLPELSHTLKMILSLENKGQPTYEETKVFAISLLFLLAVKGCDVNEFLALMISIIPSNMYDEAVNIFNCLINLSMNKFEMFQPVLQQLFVALVKTLALSDNNLRLMKLNNEIVNGLIGLFMKLMSVVPDAQNVIPQIIGDQNDQQRLAARLSKPQM